MQEARLPSQFHLSHLVFAPNEKPDFHKTWTTEFPSQNKVLIMHIFHLSLINAVSLLPLARVL